MIRAIYRPLATATRPLAARAASARFATSAAPLASDAAHLSDEDDEPHTKIREILRTKEDSTLWIGKDSLVIDAVRKMSDNNAAALLVFDPRMVASKEDFPGSVDACVGIVTERDYLRKVVLAGRSSYSTPVHQIMTPQAKVKVLTPDNDVLDAMGLMVDHDIRNVPVVDKKAMVGVLTIKDVIKTLLDDQRAQIHSLKEFIHGTSASGLA